MSKPELRVVESPAVQCPKCGTTILVGFDAAAGDRCDCPRCGTVLEVEERILFRAVAPRENGGETFERLGSAGEVSAASAGTFRLGKREIAVFEHEGEYFAVKNLCPHHGVQLSSGTVDDCRVRCPGHGYRFDLRTGRCDRDASLVLSRFDVKVQNGDLFVRVS